VVNNTEFFFRFEFGAVRCYVCKIFLKVSNLKKLEIENSEIKITEKISDEYNNVSQSLDDFLGELMVLENLYYRYK